MINPIKAIRQELSDTVRHFKDIFTVTKRSGIVEALKYDLLATQIRHDSEADFTRDQEATRRPRVVLVQKCVDINSGERFEVYGVVYLTDVETLTYSD